MLFWGGGGSEQKIKAFFLLPIPSIAGTHWHMDERRRHERDWPHTPTAQSITFNDSVAEERDPTQVCFVLLDMATLF